MIYWETVLAITRVICVIILVLLSPLLIYEYFTNNEKRARELWERMDSGISYNATSIIFVIAVALIVITTEVLNVIRG